MFSRMIVATDLSPASFAVVRCLSGLRAFGAHHCLLLQCMSYGDAASAAFSYDTGSIERLLGDQKRDLEEQGFAVETRTVVGPPKREIVRTAVDEAFDLIVVGSQGRSLVASGLLGGVAYGVVSSAQTPVLVVPIQKREDEDDVCEPVARCDFQGSVLFATDFSETADRAFAVLDQLVTHGVQKVTLVHVQDEVKLGRHLKSRLDEFNEIDRKRLENLERALLNSGRPQVDVEIVFGVPHREIARLIRERDVQLTVMGTQGRGFLGEVVLGSVAHNVVRHSVAPVLVVPPPG